MINVDDSDARITYEPKTAWTAIDTRTFVNLPSGENGTVHEASQTGSKLTLHFSGTYVEVGTILWPSGSNYSIVLDGESAGVYDTGVRTANDTVSASLFKRNGLDANLPHTIVLSKEPNHPDWSSPADGSTTSHLLFDFFLIEGFVLGPTLVPASATTSNTGPASIQSQSLTFYGSSAVSSDTPSSLKASTIVGIIIAILIAILIAICIAEPCTRNRKNGQGSSQDQHVSAQDAVNVENPSAIPRAADVFTIPVISSLPTTNDIALNSLSRDEERRLSFIDLWENRPSPRQPLSAPLVQRVSPASSSPGSETHTGILEDPQQSNVTWIAPWPVPGTISSTPSTPALPSASYVEEEAVSPLQTNTDNPFETREEQEERRQDRSGSPESLNEGTIHPSHGSPSRSNLNGNAMTSTATLAMAAPITSAPEGSGTDRVHEEITVLLERVQYLRQLAGDPDGALDELSEGVEAPPEYVDEGEEDSAA